MSEPRVLVVFATTQGHTRAVAKRIADVIGREGVGVVLADLVRVPDRLPADDLAGVVAAGAVRFGRHKRRLRRFVRRNRDALARLPSAFVSVSGASIGDEEEHRAEARGYADAFRERTGWAPDRTCLVGGEVAYTRYNPLVRWTMKFISRRQGISTDTSRDHDYTDWEAVARFAEEFGAVVRRQAGVQEAVRRGPNAGGRGRGGRPGPPEPAASPRRPDARAGSGGEAGERLEAEA